MKKVKQINNLVIKYREIEKIDSTAIGDHVTEYNPPLQDYSVWTPDNRCLEDRLTLEQAEEFCKETLDFVRR